MPQVKAKFLYPSIHGMLPSVLQCLRLASIFKHKCLHLKSPNIEIYGTYFFYIHMSHWHHYGQISHKSCSLITCVWLYNYAWHHTFSWETERKEITKPEKTLKHFQQIRSLLSFLVLFVVVVVVVRTLLTQVRTQDQGPRSVALFQNCQLPSLYVDCVWIFMCVCVRQDVGTTTGDKSRSLGACCCCSRCWGICSLLPKRQTVSQVLFLTFVRCLLKRILFM